VALPGHFGQFCGDNADHPNAAISGGSPNQLIYHALPQSSLNIA
jgi:hypothetical protein